MRDEDLQRREILEHIRREQRDDGDALLVDEVERILQPFRSAASRVYVPGNIELNHLLVERIPEAIAQRRRFDAAPLTWIGILQEADEPALLDALLEIREHRFGTHS